MRIADTSTTLTEHFFKTESLSIKLSIAPLLRGVVEVNEIEFQRPVLRLALDAKGGWNWQSFAQALGSTGYMPANVTLTSLKIVDGVLALHGADGVERTRLDGVNGELSAPALDGPYRFRGTFASGGADARDQAGHRAPEADGKVPLQASAASARHRRVLRARRARRRPDGQGAAGGRSDRAPADRRAGLPPGAARERRPRRRSRRSTAARRRSR